jgi:nickel/cobalt exporter
MSDWLLALMITAGTVGALHSLAPDHWVPFAALARARNWSPLRTARLATICGFGHVTVSALIGIGAVLVGRAAVESFGTALADAAPLLLIAFGFVYFVVALWRISRRAMLHEADHLEGVAHDHGHGHRYGHRHHAKDGHVTEWGLFLLFCADPCVALIPMVVAAAVGGWGAIASVVLVYEIATVAAIVILVQTAHAGVRAVRMPWLDRYGDAFAGALIMTVGALVTVLGI